MLLLSVVGFILATLRQVDTPNGWESSEVSRCGNGSSYLLNSTLYNFEKENYQPTAVAYEVLTSSRDHLRVVFDYYKNPDYAGTYNYRLIVSASNSDPSPLKGFSAVLNFSSRQITLSGNGDVPGVKNSEVEIFSAIASSAMEPGQEWAIEGRSNNSCLFKITGTALSASEMLGGEGNDVVASSDVGVVSVPPGLSTIGFSDWRSMKAFRDSGVRVLSFNREKQGVWQEVEIDEKSVFEPGVGYFLQNITNETIEVQPDKPFEVPSNISTPTIRKGWNLLFNGSGQDYSATDYKVSIAPSNFFRKNSQAQSWTLLQLVQSDLIADETYSIPKYYDLLSYGDKSSVTAGTIPGGAVFWVYLFDEPDLDKIALLDLDFSAKTDKEVYNNGETVRISLKVANNSNKKYSVDNNNQSDPCMYGFVVFEGEKLIYSSVPSGVSYCPNWPEQADLLPGSVIEYNQIWEVPGNISGSVKIVAYFDQSRIFSQDRKTKQIVVNIK